MNADIKSRWLTALRSGEYKQGVNVLHAVYSDSYCCLGVLCDIYANEHIDIDCRKRDDSVEYFFDAHEDLPNEISTWAGFGNYDAIPCVMTEDHVWVYVAELNDNGKSFTEIADMIERSL